MKAKYTDKQIQIKLWELKDQMEQLAQHARQTTDHSDATQSRKSFAKKLEYYARILLFSST